jgi:hypothetical protein
MTPEEKAVVDAAITWRRQLAQLFATSGSSIPDHDLAHAVDDLIASRIDRSSRWMPATFADCLPGDRIRIGQEETDVRKAHRGQWHAKDRQWIDDNGKVRDHMTPWEHEELRLDLAANPGLVVYPPDTACEILCNSERAATLALQQGFPGTSSVVN